MPLDIGEIRAVVGEGAFGRPHIARAMVAKGYVKTFDEAFDRFLTRGKPAYVPKPKWTLEEAIAAIRKAGGLSVVAHPIWYRDPERVVSLGVAAGLDGLEVIHSDQDGQKENAFGAPRRARGPPQVGGIGLPRPAGGPEARRSLPARRGELEPDGRRRDEAPRRGGPSAARPPPR